MRALDMRYVGQEHSRHRRRSAATISPTRPHRDQGAVRWGACTALWTSAPEEPAEIVSLRTTVTGLVEKPALEASPAAARRRRKPQHRMRARRISRRAASSIRRYSRARRCSPAIASRGPRSIEEHASTTVVLPGDSVEVDARRQSQYGRFEVRAEMTDRQAPRPVDPVLVEIIRNGVMAVTEEMKTNLMRTAYNMIIYEALDFTVGLFTKDGRHDLDRPRPADVHSRHVGDGEGQNQAFRRRGHSSPATSCSPTTPTSPAAISIT